MLETLGFIITALVFVVIVLAGIAAMIAKFYQKVGPDEAMVKTGLGGTVITISGGTYVFPLFHHVERMDLTLKSFEIARTGSEGLICKDNIRADIRVAFFIRIDKTEEEIREVAQSIGPRRASQIETMRELFDAKFSEALKTVGKQFEFVELYDKREKFKEEILKVIGTDLNGYRLDDAAIDFLEQTRLELLNPHNILDAEGIKKITELTSQEKIKENFLTREREKTLKKQDVEAAEAILELERQRVEAEERQKREIAEIKSREQASAQKVQEENRLSAQQAKIATDEQLGVAEENKNRQILVAQRNKERTDAVELERLARDRAIEATERERLVGLAEIEKEKVIETERRNIQEVIRERVVVERAVVEEKERIKDTEQFAEADRRKKVEIVAAEMKAEQELVRQIKAAEAQKKASEFDAERLRITADAERDAAERRTAAAKLLAEAATAEHAAEGLAEAKVLHAKADAAERQGLVEANVIKQKYASEAEGISGKAAAMKQLDGVGRDHEEFKLNLEKSKQIELSAIHAQQEIAANQATVLASALKSAKIDIVGGDGDFFRQISTAVRGGKTLDSFINNSQLASNVASALTGGGVAAIRNQLQRLLGEKLSTADGQQSVTATLASMLLDKRYAEEQPKLIDLLAAVNQSGLATAPLASIMQDGGKDASAEQRPAGE